MIIMNVFLLEALGTGLLVLIGNGAIANVLLKKTKGNDSGWLVIALGWAGAIFAGAAVAWSVGAHLNPAVTLGLAANSLSSGLTVDFGIVLLQISGQFLGAFVAALLVYVTYKQHYDATSDSSTILATFSTGPQIRNTFWNTVTEAVATFLLVIGVLFWVGNGDSFTGPLMLAMLFVAIATGVGGPTGFAINPARDLAPRIAHAILPIKGKGSSDWGYALVPVIGPIIGGVLAGLFATIVTSVLAA
ncbi:MAG: aquaporin family protein [Microbacteriaceae bacterium]|nr:aquaporin family protein [Microbacteriaceae bacterium]